MAWIVAQTTEMQGRVAPSVFHPHHGICRKKVVWAATKGLCFHSPMLLKYQVVESRLFVAVGGKAFDKREVRSGSYMLCRSFCQKRVSAGVFYKMHSVPRSSPPVSYPAEDASFCVFCCQFCLRHLRMLSDICTGISTVETCRGKFRESSGKKYYRSTITNTIVGVPYYPILMSKALGYVNVNALTETVAL